MKRLFAISMILFFLTGIIGLNYDVHYCGGRVVATSLSFVPHDLNCGMSSMDQMSSEERNEALYKPICCENEHLDFQIDEDYSDYSSISWNTVVPAIVPSKNIEPVLFQIKSLRYEFIGYSPPPITNDHTLRNQVFLI